MSIIMTMGGMMNFKEDIKMVEGYVTKVTYYDEHEKVSFNEKAPYINYKEDVK